MTRYLVTEHRAVTVTADTEEEAVLQGIELLEGHFGETYDVQVEPLTRETRE